MEEITDSAYRKICREYGTDMVFTEFIASEALVRNVDQSKKKLEFREEERPIGIQIFGHDPQNMAEAAKMAEKQHPELIDLNFGCPVKKVVNKGGGAALLKDVDRMIAITKAVVEAVDLPVSAKTRLGWDQRFINIREVAFRLQEAGIEMLILHGRTRSQMYGGIADWEKIGQLAADPGFEIPLIGNGDIDSADKAMKMIKEYKVDGLMIGRAAMGYPWIFQEIKQVMNTNTRPMPPDLAERIRICKRHLKENAAAKGENRAVIEMRKFFKSYFKGIPNLKPFRLRFYQAQSLEEVEQIFEDMQQKQDAF